MKIAYLASAALAALTLTASAAVAGTVMSPIALLTPLPVTPATTSVAAGFDNNTGKATASGLPLTNGKTATTFVDDYEFTIGGNYDTTLSGDFDNKLSQSNITSIDLTLFQGIPGPGASTELGTTGIQTLSATAGTYSYFLDDVLKPSVDYYLEADVTVPAKDIGKYSISAIASPVSAVPEPGTWVLMIAGVALTGGMLRYSRRHSSMMSAA